MGRANGGGTLPTVLDSTGAVRPDARGAQPVTELVPPKSLPAGVRKAWREIAGPMAAAGLLDQADAPALEAAARCVDRWRLADEVLDREGLTIEAHGGIHAHPMVAVSNKAQAEYRAWSARLGLTPVDRVSLGLASLRGQSLAQDISGKIGSSPRKGGTGG
jgi:P27 family predicted phage terminase small subunit